MIYLQPGKLSEPAGPLLALRATLSLYDPLSTKWDFMTKPPARKAFDIGVIRRWVQWWAGAWDEDVGWACFHPMPGDAAAKTGEWCVASGVEIHPRVVRSWTWSAKDRLHGISRWSLSILNCRIPRSKIWSRVPPSILRGSIWLGWGSLVVVRRRDSWTLVVLHGGLAL